MTATDNEIVHAFVSGLATGTTRAWLAHGADRCDAIQAGARAHDAFMADPLEQLDLLTHWRAHEEAHR